MRKIALFSLFIALSTLITACGKGGDDNNACSETAMQISTSPANGSTEPASVGPDFPLTININTGIPAAGVTIEITASKESGGSPYFTKTLTDVKLQTTNVTITGTTAATANIVKITVTSKTCASNKWSGSYRYSMK